MFIKFFRKFPEFQFQIEGFETKSVNGFFRKRFVA